MTKPIEIKQTVWAVISKESSDGTPVLFVAKRSKNVKNSGLWGFFGGTIDRGEGPTQALKREVLEEAGLVVTSLRHLTTITQPDKVLHYYEVEVKKLKIKLNKESSRFKWLSEKQLALQKKLLHSSVKNFLLHAHKKALKYRLSMISANLQQQVTAYIDDRIVGGATITLVNGALHNFHINPEFQGKGYAHELMQYLLQLPTPPRRLTAQASMGSPVKGKDLVNFYTKYGFKIRSDGDTNVRMER